MQVLIPRIPPQTTRADLKHFIEDEIKSWVHLPFTDEPKMFSYDILEITDQDGVCDHHGLVTVMPDSAGEKVIDHLSGKRIHGKQIFPREYFEREAKDAMEQDEERRRSNLTITKITSLR